MKDIVEREQIDCSVDGGIGERAFVTLEVFRKMRGLSENPGTGIVVSQIEYQVREPE